MERPWAVSPALLMLWNWRVYQTLYLKALAIGQMVSPVRLKANFLSALLLVSKWNRQADYIQN
jgi:hypothetical protein